MQEIKVVLTMDCEPTTATSHPAATGPATWDAGEPWKLWLEVRQILSGHKDL